MFAWWGHIVYRFRWLMLGASGLLLAGSLVALFNGGTTKNSGGGSTESGRAVALMQSQLPQNGAGSSFVLVFGSQKMPVQDPAFKTAVLSALQPLQADQRVKSIETPFDVTPELARAMTSTDGHHVYALVTLKDDYPTARQYYTQLRAKVHSDQLQVLGTGNVAIAADFDKYLQADLQRAELVSLVVVVVLLLLVFGTVVSALLPLGVGGVAVVGGLAAVGVLARFTDVSTYATNIVTLIGLGVAIDYSLFIVNRFREELAAGRATEQALIASMRTSGRAVTFSGITVAIGLSAMLFFQGSFLASMGFAGAIVVAIAVLYALTFLASLLAILGHRVTWLRVPLPRGRAGRGFWHGLAMRVMRRPVLVLVPIVALLLVMASPFFQIKIANGDVGMLPPNAESRRGYDQLQQFPGQGQTFFSVVVHYSSGGPLTADRIGGLYDLAQTIKQIPGVESVESLVTYDSSLSRSAYQALLTQPAAAQPARVQAIVHGTTGPQIAVLSVVTKNGQESDASRAIVHSLRTMTPPAGSSVLVDAFSIDFTDFILQRIPLAVGYVMIVTYFVLFLLTGSVVLPLKAVIMNILSIGASFGALVWIFQQGHLSSLLNFTAAPLDPSVPVLLFCIVFGLSMDYEVLLISRIQEEYRRTGDTTQAVADGLEKSGRLITGAAGIMVAVFLAFGLADVVLIKSIGLGLAIAVAIDATLVRALIVPAVMRLLGRTNWWAPRPLARWHRRFTLEGRIAA
ncbi:MAG TPA: MMPL family transporter [Candidatus Dormibacteraeota bacterium]|jgi:RND superfamily putative drug exporter|nr:MMPL family transporter [Candidatus Dormibacteraeota bacterium]